jgi:hypothetical protein
MGMMDKLDKRFYDRKLDNSRNLGKVNREPFFVPK